MTVALPSRGAPAPPRRRLRRLLVEGGSAVLGFLIAFWSLVPIYNMLLIALAPEGNNEYAGKLWPDPISLDSFIGLWTEATDELENVWEEFGNSIVIGLSVMVLTVAIGSLAAFSVSRLRLAREWTLSDAALVTYIIPSSFLLVPFFRVMHEYGLSDNLLAVILAEVAFATPYAILVLQHYGKLIPIELDEAARVDGASAVQVYLRIYLPLIAPALAAVGTYALLFAWNDYLYQYLLLTSQRHTTVAVGLEQFFDDDDSPWNYMMALAIVYSLPPIAMFYALRRYIAAGLTLGAVKG
jgi:multiple sugar transport system permease protein